MRLQNGNNYLDVFILYYRKQAKHIVHCIKSISRAESFRNGSKLINTKVQLVVLVILLFQFESDNVHPFTNCDLSTILP